MHVLTNFALRQYRLLVLAKCFVVEKNINIGQFNCMLQPVQNGVQMKTQWTDCTKKEQ